MTAQNEEHDIRISALYQRSASEDPPAHVDAAILAAAHAAVGRDQARSPPETKPLRKRSTVPWALAASIVLVTAVVFVMRPAERSALVSMEPAAVPQTLRPAETTLALNDPSPAVADKQKAAPLTDGAATESNKSDAGAKIARDVEPGRVVAQAQNTVRGSKEMEATDLPRSKSEKTAELDSRPTTAPSQAPASAAAATPVPAIALLEKNVGLADAAREEARVRAEEKSKRKDAIEALPPEKVQPEFTADSVVQPKLAAKQKMDAGVGSGAIGNASPKKISGGYQRDGWPGEGVPHFLAPTNALLLYPEPDQALAPVKVATPPNSEVLFDTSIVRTLRSVFLTAKDRVSDVFCSGAKSAKPVIQPGEVIEYLQYGAEGYGLVRYRTEICTVFLMDRTPRFDGIDQKPEVEWWVRVVDENKQVRGWLLVESAAGSNQQIKHLARTF